MDVEFFSIPSDSDVPFSGRNYRQHLNVHVKLSKWQQPKQTKESKENEA
jgi:hypothetical protein